MKSPGKEFNQKSHETNTVKRDAFTYLYLLVSHFSTLRVYDSMNSQDIEMNLVLKRSSNIPEHIH